MCSSDVLFSFSSSISCEVDRLQQKALTDQVLHETHPGQLNKKNHNVTSALLLTVPWQDGTAPLWMAAQMGHSEVVKVLLLRGADRDADRKVRRSPGLAGWSELFPTRQTHSLH